jgi:hypothetical protein
MATIVENLRAQPSLRDSLSGTPRAHPIDRWIYVFTAASFIVIVLTGFIPDSLAKVAAVQADARPPFPLVLHFHAILMGSFLLLLLAQSWLMATGRCEMHMRLGLVSLLLAPALVIVGFLLVPTMYHQLWSAAQTAPPAVANELAARLGVVENIMLLQIRIGILFPVFIAIALAARRRDAGLHKRMMFLGTAMALPAGLDRIPWLYTSLPGSPVTPDLYMVIALSPMIAWDLIRNRRVHHAYWIWLAILVPAAVLVHSLWDTPGWHATARQLMGV